MSDIGVNIVNTLQMLFITVYALVIGAVFCWRVMTLLPGSRRRTKQAIARMVGAVLLLNGLILTPLMGVRTTIMMTFGQLIGIMLALVVVKIIMSVPLFNRLLTPR